MEPKRQDQPRLSASRLSELAHEIETVMGRAGAPLSLEEMLSLIRDQFRSRSRAEVFAALCRMIEDGAVLEADGGAYALSAASEWMAGTVSGTRSGLVFFDPDEPQQGDDLSYVVAADQAQGVFPGDRVRVVKLGLDNRGRVLVSIREVIERGTTELVGTVQKRGNDFWLKPSDPKVHVPVKLAGPGPIPGQGVVAEIITQPSAGAPARAQVKEMLGSAEDPSVEIEMAVRRFGMPSDFEPDVQAEADSLPSRVLKKDAARRVDLRDIAFVTIDGEDARDFDDAVWCAPLAKGGWRLLVAIADVSWYVRPGSALDRSAQERLTSVYFPRRVIPMLPVELSNGLCSLNPDVDRCTMVCDAVISSEGVIEAYQFYPGLIHSHARLTYTQVWSALQGEPEGIAALGAVLPDVQSLYRLFKALLAERRRRGAINFETKETQVVTDEDGRISAIVPREHNDAHRLIEESMLVANTCAADFLIRRKAEGLFRVHAGPAPERLAQLRATLAGFGLKLGGGAKPAPADYEAVMRQVRGKPEEEAVQLALLTSMSRAVYSPDEIGHFGLAYQAYTHFTSPIRRYPDLLVHRAIRGILSRRRYKPLIAVDGRALLAEAASARKPAAAPVSAPEPISEAGPMHETWAELGRMCSAAERRADEASLDVTAWLKCSYMEGFIGRSFAGTVTGVTPNGVYVTLKELFVEGFVHVSSLGWDYYVFDSASSTLEGSASGERIRTGAPITVVVSAVDLDARRIEFRREDCRRRRSGRAGGWR